MSRYWTGVYVRFAPALGHIPGTRGSIGVMIWLSGRRPAVRNAYVILDVARIMEMWVDPFIGV